VTEPSPFRSGFACLVGRPNAGKSTLTNALVGQKIVIASSKPQTTRHAVRGILHRPDAQLVIIDTPGLHKPRTLLGERLNDVVRTTWSEVDIVGVCLPANERIGPGDRYLVGGLAALPRKPSLVAIATKSDLASPDRIAEHLASIAALEVTHKITWADIIPVSVPQRFQLDVLSDALIGLLPEGPSLYPDGEITDEPEETLVAELIREAALEGVRDELPHSITVTVEEMGLRDDRPADKPLLDIYASLVVERDSQKGIVIGHRGSRLREIGAAARQQIEALLGTPVFLDLRVKVLKEWQRNAKHLNRLGF
jgi:GTPase